MSAVGPDAKFRIVYGLVKVTALVLGSVGTLVTCMAFMGALTDRLWLRATVAVVVALLVPLVIADRLLPSDPQRARGLPTDVLAVVWLGCALVAAWAGGGLMHGLLVREGDRLASEGMPVVARAAYLLAGVRAQLAAPGLAVSSASAIASGSASAPPADVCDACADVEETSAVDAAVQEAAKDAGREKGERTPAELFKELSPAVVTISVKLRGGAEGGGTGFLIDRDGVVATNHHVVDQASAVRIKFGSGQKFTSVELLVDDAAQDLALLKIDYSGSDAGTAPELKPLQLGDSDSVQVGERVISIGNPLGLEHTLTDGLVSARRMFEGRQWIQMSAPVSPGNSGGPLFDMRGEVIGVTTAQLGVFARGQNLNLAVPVNVLKGLIKPSYPARRRIGDDSSPTHW